jgi:non-ribosomal peptide synthetase component F
VSSIYDQYLDKNRANFSALSPVSFVERSTEVFGDLPAVIHGAQRYDWRALRDRSARLAAALRALGVGRGTTVVDHRVQRRDRVMRLDHLGRVGQHCRQSWLAAQGHDAVFAGGANPGGDGAHGGACPSVARHETR